MTDHPAGGGHTADAVERAAMARARELAERGRATGSPHPVGCVVLDRAGNAVGEGWHERPGAPHAEVMALAAAGTSARGGTAVVTLEPCRHTGRTPPCTQALLAAGVRRVVFAVADPGAAEGGGAEVLRAAGVDVVGGLDEAEGARLLGSWLVAARLGRPYVIWKYAATLDGRVAAADSTSRWITGPAARAQVHELRGQVDAIMVGVGTVLADDPHLTARDHRGVLGPDQPLRVVVDSAGRTPATARVRDGAAPTLIATAAEFGDGQQSQQVDLGALLAALKARGVHRLLLEGGPRLSAAMLLGGWVDFVRAYVAPTLLGGGASVVAGLGIESMSSALRLQVVDVAWVGDDIRIDATLPSGEIVTS